MCFSEFYSADGLVHSKFLADSVLPHHPSEKPLIVQIFGKDPEMFVQAAKIIEKYKFDLPKFKKMYKDGQRASF